MNAAPSPLQTAHGILRRASELAHDFLHGTPDQDAKVRAKALSSEILDVPIDDIPKGEVDATHTVLKAARMLVDSVNRAAFTHNEFRTQMKAIIKACLPLKEIAGRKFKSEAA